MEQIFPGLDNALNGHPVFVHFPIALWLGAALFCSFGALRARDDVFAAGRWLLYLGTAGAVLAVATGLGAAEELGHDSPGHEFVHVHRNLMLITSAIALVTAIVAFVVRNRPTRAARWGVVASLLLIAGLTILGADRGAELVFRYGMGVAGDSSPASSHQGGHQDTHAHDDHS